MVPVDVVIDDPFTNVREILLHRFLPTHDFDDVQPPVQLERHRVEHVRRHRLIDIARGAREMSEGLRAKGRALGLIDFHGKGQTVIQTVNLTALIFIPPLGSLVIFSPTCWKEFGGRFFSDSRYLWSGK